MMTTIAQRLPAVAVWLGRVRFVFAVALVWAGLHFLAGSWLLPRGLDRPLVLSACSYGPLGGLAVVGLLWIGAALTVLLLGCEDPRQPLFTIGWALALWGAEGGRLGGTMDRWLIDQHERPGPPTGGPYWLLLVDYLYLVVAIAGAYVIGWRLRPERGSPRPADRPPTRDSGRAPDRPFSSRPEPLGQHLLQPFAALRTPRPGLAALAMNMAVGLAAIFFLMGPATDATRRGQVYLAVLFGFLAAAYLTRRMLKTTDAVCYWPAPLLLGIVGLIVAGVRPALMLPAAYRNIDTIPAWALGRPLPVEMVGVGLVGALWLLRKQDARATFESRSERSTQSPSERRKSQAAACQAPDA